MKPFFILLGLSICVISLSAQEAYQYNQFYYQRATLFEKLPIDSDDIVFLGNSITNDSKRLWEKRPKLLK